MDPTDPVSIISHLSSTLTQAASTSPLSAADLLDTIRRHLPSLPPSFNPSPLSTSITTLLSTHPTNLLLSHRAVAVLAHPSLCAPEPSVEPSIVATMDRLQMSAAFQHTAMAALQNAASSVCTDRDAVVLAVVSAMRHHHTHAGILLRGADLIAYHLNQQLSPPLTSSFRVASRIVVDTSPTLAATPQGASTALLALVAAARHASSLATFASGRPSSTARFSRGNSSSLIIDTPFAAAVTAAMSKHPTYAPVQVLGAEVIRVACAGASAVAKSAAKEFHAAGAVSACLAMLQTLSAEVSVVDRSLVALRSLLLGGGGHGRGIKPGLLVDNELAVIVAGVVDAVSENVALRDRDLSSAAAVLGMDVRAAVGGERGKRTDGGKFAAFGKRVMRRIRFGGRNGWYDAEYNRFAEEGFTEKGADPVRKDPARNHRVNGRSSFSILQMSPNYTRGGGSNQDVKDFRSPAASARIDGGRANRKVSEGAGLPDNLDDRPQISLNKKWRSVSGRWNQRGRRGSTTGMESSAPPAINSTTTTTTTTQVKRERRGPLTLSGSEMANLTRQPSRIFGTGGEGMGGMRVAIDSRGTEGRPTFLSAGHEDFGF